MLNLGSRQLRILFNAMMLGDGSWDPRENRTSGSYSTTSKHLADDVQELAFKLGYSCSLRSHQDKRGRRLRNYTISICQRSEYCIHDRAERRTITREHYNGPVYCFTVPSGLFITRRNGKIGIHGNSAQASQEASDIEGLLPYFSWLKSVIDDVIQRHMMFTDYEIVFEELVEPDQEKQSVILTTYVSKCVLTPNEARERLGEEPDTSPESEMLGVVTGTGFVPIGGAGALTTPSPNPVAAAGAGGDDGVLPDKKPNGSRQAGDEGNEDSAGGKPNSGGGRTNADGRGKPRAPRSANKPNGNKAALEAQAQARPIGFAPGTQEAEVLEPRGLVRGTLEIEKREAVAKEAPVIHPGRLLPPSILGRHKLERELKKRFKVMNRKTVKVLAGVLELPHKHLAKADDVDDTAQQVMDELADEWQAIAEAAAGPITDASVAGADNGSLQLSITSEDMLQDINTVARDWAGNRAAELVGMRKKPDGTLIENPNPKWAITDSTRNDLRTIIKDIFGQGEDIALRDVEDRIEQAGIFSDTRASMIARTEISFAQTQGNLASWKISGLVEGVNVQLAADHDKDDECDDVAAGGPYSLDDVPDVPVHPNCLCAIVLAQWSEDVE